MNWHKEAFKSLTTISLSVFISTLVARLIFSFTVIEIWAIGVLFFMFFLSLVITIKSEWIGEKYWGIHMRKKFQAPLIGILQEEQCENIADGHLFTSFLANDWNTELRRLGLNTKLISIDQLTDEYAVIINPYGEVYPEREPILLLSFQKIKEYIRHGGIFVCAGGYPFFYCWDSRTRKRITLSKILPAYVEIGQNNLGQNVLLPRFFYPPLYSFLDTIVNEHFGVNVIGDIQTPQNAPPGWLPIYQTHQANEDIQYVGNLAQVGGINQVFVFRSIMPVTRCCIPFLRADIPNIGEVFPIAGIPYERGLLIVCGMDLQTIATVGNVNIARGEFEKVCLSINNILNGIKLETISYDWQKQR